MSTNTSTSASGSSVCYRCGDKGHKANDKNCRAQDARCSSCNKIGHFARVCQSTKVNFVTETEQDDADYAEHEHMDTNVSFSLYGTNCTVYPRYQ